MIFLHGNIYKVKYACIPGIGLRARKNLPLLSSKWRQILRCFYHTWYHQGRENNTSWDSNISIKRLLYCRPERSYCSTETKRSLCRTPGVRFYTSNFNVLLILMHVVMPAPPSRQYYSAAFAASICARPSPTTACREWPASAHRRLYVVTRRTPAETATPVLIRTVAIFIH